MPVLENPKHERFAQELAKGKTGDKAYVLAGYKRNADNASRLKGNESIRARVVELQSRAAERAEISVASVTDALLRIARKAESIGEPSALAVARASYVDAAKINGLVIDRKDIGAPGDFARMNEDELASFIEERIGTLGGGVTGAGKPQPAPGLRGSGRLN